MILIVLRLRYMHTIKNRNKFLQVHHQHICTLIRLRLGLQSFCSWTSLGDCRPQTTAVTEFLMKPLPLSKLTKQHCTALIPYIICKRNAVPFAIPPGGYQTNTITQNNYYRYYYYYYYYYYYTIYKAPSVVK